MTEIFQTWTNRVEWISIGNRLPSCRLEHIPTRLNGGARKYIHRSRKNGAGFDDVVSRRSRSITSLDDVIQLYRQAPQYELTHKKLCVLYFLLFVFRLIIYLYTQNSVVFINTCMAIAQTVLVETGVPWQLDLYAYIGTNYPYGKNVVFLIENLNGIVPKLWSQRGLGQEPHWASRTSSKTSLRIKTLLRFSLRFSMRIFSHWESQWESQWGLAQDLDFWWSSWWGSWFSMRFLPKTSLRSWFWINLIEILYEKKISLKGSLKSIKIFWEIPRYML